MAGPIDDATRIVPNPRAVYRKLADGAGGVVLHLDTAAYHGVNETGAYIWSLLEEQGVSLSDLVARLQADMDGAPPALADEVRAFVAALLERDLVSLASRSTDEAPAADG